MKLSYKFVRNNVDFTKALQKFLNNLEMESLKYFEIQKKQKQLVNEKEDKIALYEAIKNLEQFFYYNFINLTNMQFYEFIVTISKNLDIIAVLPANRRNVYGRNIPEEKTIYVNPKMGNSSYLTGLERKKLNIAHEVGHIIHNNRWLNKIREEVNKSFIKEIGLELSNTYYGGFVLLDEIATQERAEDFAYWAANKKRPPYRNSYYRQLVDSNSKPIMFKTNLDYYGELQEPAILFSKMIFGENYTDEELLKLLSKKATSPDFIDFIKEKLTSIGAGNNFVNLMRLLGLLKRGSYAKFSEGDEIYMQEFYKNLNAYNKEVKSILECMRKSNKHGSKK